MDKIYDYYGLSEFWTAPVPDDIRFAILAGCFITLIILTMVPTKD